MTQATNPIAIRRARPGDADALLRLVAALAEYEKLPPPDPAACQRLLADAFAEHPRIDITLALAGEEPVGYAITFETYSSFLALPTLYLEDLFVLPEYRGMKAGKSLFLHCVAEAQRRGCGRLEFMVLDWNKSAREFYARLGVEELKEWVPYRLGREDFGRVLAEPRGNT